MKYKFYGTYSELKKFIKPYDPKGKWVIVWDTAVFSSSRDLLLRYYPDTGRIKFEIESRSSGELPLTLRFAFAAHQEEYKKATRAMDADLAKKRRQLKKKVAR